MKTSINLDRSLTLIDLLEKRTREGDLIWEDTEEEETFQANSASYSIRIKPEELSSDFVNRLRISSISLEAINPYPQRFYVLEIFDSSGNKTNEIGVKKLYSARGSTLQPSSNSAVIATGLDMLNLHTLESIHRKLVDIYDMAKNQILAKETDIDKLIAELL